MADKLYPLSANRKEELMKELMQNVIKTSSNLLDPIQRPSWNDLSRREQMQAATSMLVGLEENAYLLADNVNYEKVLVKADRNVMMSLKVYEVQNVMKEIHFPTNEDLNNQVWHQASDSITLPAEAVLDTTENGLVKVVFFTFNNLEELLQPFNDNDDAWVGVGEEEAEAGESLSSSSSSSSSSSNGTKTTRILNTRIISASIGRSRHISLRQPAIVTLRHLREENVSNPTCAFWNYDTNSWSSIGCQVVSANRTHTVCSCDHLTNFAVLMDVHGVKISSNDAIALQMITYVGCIISIVCLAFAFFTFAIFRGLKSDRTTIHRNLCACLLIAEIIFLVGINQVDKPIVCGVIAGLLHYFFLCSFAWMFLEGFQLYVMLIEVFESEKSRIRWYYAIAYVVPALIVAVSCIVDPFSYGTSQHCWLRTDNYFIFSFVGPVIVILTFNLIFLSIAVFMMCRHSNTSAAIKNKEQSRLASIRMWLRGAIVLVFLLGLTWTFGLLYLNEESVIMAYIFTVLNSLQGFFIFIFHCVQNEKVQKEYKKLLRRSQCLPSCIKPESEKERRSSFYVNGTTSIPNSTSTSSAIQQSNFKRLWESQNGRTGSGRSTLSKSGTPPGLQANGLPDLENEKSSYKSSNRDSGHGGSDHEEIHNNQRSNNQQQQQQLQQQQQQPSADNYGGMSEQVDDPEFINNFCNNKEINHTTTKVNNNKHHPQPKEQQQHNRHHNNRLRGHPCYMGGGHPVRLSPHNHIYMDIDGHHHRHLGDSNGGVCCCSEPVYEEIEHGRHVHHSPAGSPSPAASHHEPQISDLSDEDGRRRSDISRQSSGSYGDNRPLIPHANYGGSGSGGSIGGSVGGSGGASTHRHERERNLHNNLHHPLHPHPHYHPRTATRGRPPPPPEPTLDLDGFGGNGGVLPLAVPPPQHPSVYYYADTTNRQQRVAMEDGVTDGDAGYPSDNLLIAMLDGSKVVNRLKPVIPNSLQSVTSSTHRPNSFSEC